MPILARQSSPAAPIAAQPGLTSSLRRFCGADCWSRSRRSATLPDGRDARPPRRDAMGARGSSLAGSAGIAAHPPSGNAARDAKHDGSGRCGVSIPVSVKVRGSASVRYGPPRIRATPGSPVLSAPTIGCGLAPRRSVASSRFCRTLRGANQRGMRRAWRVSDARSALSCHPTSILTRRSMAANLLPADPPRSGVSSIGHGEAVGRRSTRCSRDTGLGSGGGHGAACHLGRETASTPAT